MIKCCKVGTAGVPALTRFAPSAPESRAHIHCIQNVGSTKACQVAQRKLLDGGAAEETQSGESKSGKSVESDPKSGADAEGYHDTPRHLGAAFSFRNHLSFIRELRSERFALFACTFLVEEFPRNSIDTQVSSALSRNK